MHDTVYSEAKHGAGAGRDYRKGGGRGQGSGGADRSNTFYQCGKTREENGDKRFCRREAVAAVGQPAQPQQAAPPPTPRDEKGGRGGCRGNRDGKKKLPSATDRDKCGTEFTILDGGAHLGYEEMIYAKSTGASTVNNLLQYLADGEPLECCCVGRRDFGFPFRCGGY